jgi:hypothetical protein
VAELEDPAPLIIEIKRTCRFKSRGRNDRGNRLPGCAHCRKAKLDPSHLGAPPSTRDMGSSMDKFAYQALKQTWMLAIAVPLQESGLPRQLERVTAEVELGFDTYAHRDEGNFRFIVEKALGDVLVHGMPGHGIAGGWLPDDSFFPVQRYSMGNVTAKHTPGESSTRIVIFATFRRAPRVPRGGETPALELEL